MERGRGEVAVAAADGLEEVAGAGVAAVGVEEVVVAVIIAIREKFSLHT